MSEQTNQLFKGSGGKLLTLHIDGQEYGIQILETREVVGLMDIESVPKTPHFMKGIINLRGKIIPIIDLRIKFGFEAQEDSMESCIIVVDVHHKLTGAIVDQLEGVLNIEESQFEERPHLGTNIQADYILGMAKIGKRVITVLNMEKVLSNEELQQTHNSVVKSA